MARGNGNGNGNGGRNGGCPHDCARCKAIEVGLGGRLLTPSELLVVHGSPVEPTREGRVVWADDTAEAELSRDVAQLAYEDACRVFGEISRDVTAQLERLRGDERWNRERELGAVIDAANAEREEAGARLSAARGHFHALARRDSLAHARGVYLAAQAAQNEAREQAKVARRGGRLARLRS